MENNNSRELNTKIGVLETKIDLLETELLYIHEILMRCGFPHGIHTLKLTLEDILSQQTGPEASASGPDEFFVS